MISAVDALAARPNCRRNILQRASFAAAAFVASPVLATEDAPPPCNEECMEERKRRILERRAMMQQSRTTTRRQDMFELSKQRATLVYNTTYQGASCPPGVPCI